jgi:excisionase family DNA binding protein
MTARLLTIDEAAQFLSISKTTIRRWTKSGQLSCSRVGVKGERRFLKSDLEACISTQEKTVPHQFLNDISNPLLMLTDAATRGIPRHVCLHYQTRDEQWGMFRQYVLEHLEMHAPILYIHEESSRADVLSRFKLEGFDPEQLIQDNLLRLLVPSEAYLRSEEFIPERMVDFMEAAILAYRASGHETVLISGDMSWYLKSTPGVERMIEYEFLLNKLLNRYPKVTIVCQYDSCRLNGTVTLGAICSHPHVQLKNQFVSGYYTEAFSST